MVKRSIRKTRFRCPKCGYDVRIEALVFCRWVDEDHGYAASPVSTMRCDGDSYAECAAAACSWRGLLSDCKQERIR